MDIISIGIASQAKTAAKLAQTAADNAAATAGEALVTANKAEDAICCAGIFTGKTTQSGTNLVTTVMLANVSTQEGCQADLDELKDKIGAILARNGKAWITVHSLFMNIVHLTQRIDFLLPVMGTLDTATPDFMEARSVFDLSAFGGSGILDKTVRMRWSDIVIAENDGTWEATLTITVSMV